MLNSHRQTHIRALCIHVLFAYKCIYIYVTLRKEITLTRLSCPKLIKYSYFVSWGWRSKDGREAVAVDLLYKSSYKVNYGAANGDHGTLHCLSVLIRHWAENQLLQPCFSSPPLPSPLLLVEWNPRQVFLPPFTFGPEENDSLQRD